jgi:hypothetical protein
MFVVVVFLHAVIAGAVMSVALKSLFYLVP